MMYLEVAPIENTHPEVVEPESRLSVVKGAHDHPHCTPIGASAE